MVLKVINIQNMVQAELGEKEREARKLFRDGEKSWLAYRDKMKMGHMAQIIKTNIKEMIIDDEKNTRSNNIET